jgi:uncharacterized membrane protein YkvA (DUF1232 family)
MAKNFTDAEINAEFDKARKNISEDDVHAVLDKRSEIFDLARGPLAQVAEDIKLLVSIIEDYVNGSYKELPWMTIAAIVGTLLYVLSPIDLIPDFIPVIGWLDDLAVLGLCLKAIHVDLQKYKDWKTGGKTP